MKIHSVKIVLDKDVFIHRENVTGKLIVKTSDANWGTSGKVFLKFYDKLDIHWIESELVFVGTVNYASVTFENKKKPFQVNLEAILGLQHVTRLENDTNHDFIFAYPFSFTLPEKIQGTSNLARAKCNYYIKAYLSNDEAAFQHYLEGANVFDSLFRGLNHKYCKQEVVILNKTLTVQTLSAERYILEAKSEHLKAIVTLPKKIYERNETIPVHILVEHIDSKDNDHALNLHKVSFKLMQVVKVHSEIPIDKSTIFENLISHSSRKNIHQNAENSIVLEEYFQIPNIIQSSSSRTTIEHDSTNGKNKNINPIRVNYKLGIEFWKSLFANELDVNIPILISPEV